MIEALNKRYHFILGSQSPRRKDLLTQLGLSFEVRPSPYQENHSEDVPVSILPEFLAEQKGLALKESLLENDVLITADTLVILEGKVLGKPKDLSEAFSMIRNLSGKWHQVTTGVCLLTHRSKSVFSETTQVHFKELSDEEINYYINHYEVLDKAGAYGIQEWIGLVAVNEIKGCFFNVIGLPVPRLYKSLIAL